MKQEKGVVPSSSTNITTNNAAATSGASHPMAAEALAAQANFEVTAFHFYHKVVRHEKGIDIITIIKKSVQKRLEFA